MQDLVAVVRDAAQELGTQKLAFVCLHDESEPAQSILKNIKQSNVAAKPLYDLCHSEVLLLTVKDVSRLLSRHCGTGGARIAAKIDGDDGAAWDYLNVGVLPDGIEVYSILDGQETFYAAADFGHDE